MGLVHTGHKSVCLPPTHRRQVWMEPTGRKISTYPTPALFNIHKWNYCKWKVVYTKDITLSTTTENKHTFCCIWSSNRWFRGLFSERNIYNSKRFWNGNITRNIWHNCIFRKDPVRCKITVDNKCLHQVMSFKYLICESSFENETEIVKEWKEEPVDTKLRRYKSNWLQHVTRMNNNRMPKITLNYRPNGQTQLGRRLKRLLDEAKTGLLWPNLWWMMMVMDSFSVSMTCENSSKCGWSNTWKSYC